jgi:lipoprotein signal peptidase
MVLTPAKLKTKLTSFLLLITLVLTDQITKKIALGIKDPLNIGPFTIESTFNPYSALSLYQGPLLYLTILQTICVAGLIIFSQKVKNHLTNTGYILLLAGGISNLLDRAINANGFLDGAVIDMVKIADLVTINLADILITLGLLTMFIKRNKKNLY